MGLNPLLEVARVYLESEVAPQANEIDRDPEALRLALQGLCDRHLMALRRPGEYGGPALTEAEFREFQEMVARTSGSLAFLQTQHQSAVSMIAKGDNEALKARVLPMMSDGTLLCGIGFSQLRRPGPPVLTATEVAEGYQLDGAAPWVTGYGFYHKFLIGASLPDSRAVFGLVPFQPVEGLSFSEPMRLAAMESPQTVSAQLTGFVLKTDDVSAIKPHGWIHDNDLINVTIQGFFAIGCARAGLDIVSKAYERRGVPFIKSSLDSLQGELEECRGAMIQSQSGDSEDVTTDEKLRVRAWAIDLAVRCAHAGVTVSSGAANMADNDAQRVYREALVYTVSAQTGPIMQATLERLVRRGG